MDIVAGTLLTFGVEKLWDLLVRETERLKGVDEQYSELKSDINLLRSFLKDADAKKHASDLVRNCVEEVKEIVLDAEDMIETFLLKEELGRTGGMRNHMRRRAFSKVDRNKFASDLGDISKRISKVICNMQNFGVQPMIVDDNKYSVPLQERQREMRRTFPSNNESNLVGLQKNVKKLIGYLIEEDCIQIVSISGMGGIGKTTLAKQVFNHDMVKKHFDGLAWVCVSETFTQKYVWQTIFQQLSLKHVEHKDSNMTEDELHGKLFRLLETGKYLIVLDDMWKREDWDRVKHVFPVTKGCKLILTSRNERVGLHADPTCVTFKPEFLTPEESWNLFKNIAFPSYDTSEFKVNEEMEELGKKMIKQCGGLPLAVKVLGGLLTSQHKLHEWKRIYENIGSHLIGRSSFSDGNHNSVQHVLSISFEELPNSLKQCFLYLAHFPEDYLIDMEKLSYCWAAEGIFKPENYERASIRDVADMYMEELVKRNMVMFEGYDEGTSRFKTCRLHDMMREVCLLKVKEENFLDIFHGTRSKSPYRSRRLVVYLPNKKYVMERIMENPKLRSFMFIMGELRRSFLLMNSSFCFTQLQLMRVLDISGATFEGGKLCSSIGNLIHLRYLSLYRTYITHLPSSMQKLKKLFYLNLDVGEGIYVPNILKDMQDLRYLSLPIGKFGNRMHDKTKLELGNLTNLETLENFSIMHSSVEDLQGMTRLVTLSINLYSVGWTKETLSSSLSELSHLEVLHIDDNNLCFFPPINGEEGFVLDCVNVKELHLNIFMRRLHKENFPSRLTTIYFGECFLVEDPMPILEKLLHLKKVCFEHESFCGRRMVFSGGGFPKLQKLLLFGLEKWKDWVVEEGSMPLLRTLVILACRKLKELPEELQSMTSLKELTMNEEWTNRLSEGGNDYYKVQHIPSIKFMRFYNYKDM